MRHSVCCRRPEVGQSNVRFTPENGHSTVRGPMTASDPKRTLAKYAEFPNYYRNFLEYDGLRDQILILLRYKVIL